MKKWIDEKDSDKRYINWTLRSFDLTYKLGELGFVQITHDDLRGAQIEFIQKLKVKENTDDKKQQCEYTLKFRLENCKVRNVATEALDIFRDIAAVQAE